MVRKQSTETIPQNADTLGTSEYVPVKLSSEEAERTFGWLQGQLLLAKVRGDKDMETELLLLASEVRSYVATAEDNLAYLAGMKAFGDWVEKTKPRTA